MPDQNLLYYGDNLDIPSLYQRRDGRSGLPRPAVQKRSGLQRPIRRPPRCPLGRADGAGSHELWTDWLFCSLLRWSKTPSAEEDCWRGVC